MFATFEHSGDIPLIATAIHAGHDLRREVDELMLLDEQTRRREEDPHTDSFATEFDTHVVVHRSRFEVDLNRPRAEAVYVTPDDAWGLDIWKEEPGADLISTSRRLHDAFYENLALTLDDLVEEYGGFVLYDIHSYNHLRNGPDGPPEDPAGNPAVNLGTGSLPAKWAPVAKRFLDVIGRHSYRSAPLDARENVKFRGRELAEFVHGRYGDVGCALAIEFKKTFMNEWTDEVDREAQSDLAKALLSTVEPVIGAWSDRARE